MQHPPPLRASYASTSAGGGTANQARHAQPHSHTVNRDEHQNGHDKVASASTALDRVLGLMDGFEVSTHPSTHTHTYTGEPTLAWPSHWTSSSAQDQEGSEC